MAAFCADRLKPLDIARAATYHKPKGTPMDKKYFYLDADRTAPKGPCTIDELSAMMMAGLLTPATEVAAEGDAEWQPLCQLLMEHKPGGGAPPVPGAVAPVAMPPVPTPHMDPGACPDCGTPLETQDGMLPPRCPACGRILRPENDTLWANAMMALKQYATLSGRATRKEFWSFALYQFVLLFGLVILFTASLAWMLILKSEGMDATLQAVLCCVILAVIVLVALALTIPGWCLTVRRLHDMGQSGYWALANIILSVLCSVLAGVAIAWGLAGAFAAAPADQDAVGCMQSVVRCLQDMESQKTIGAAGALGIVSSLCEILSNILGIAIFVMMFLDSVRGPNKYGPSRKYPRG